MQPPSIRHSPYRCIRKLVDELDEGLQPYWMVLVSIDEMFNELPLLHRALAPPGLRKRAGRKLKVYRGCYDWCKSLGFSYVQIGTTLHVLEFFGTTRIRNSMN